MKVHKGSYNIVKRELESKMKAGLEIARPTKSLCIKAQQDLKVVTSIKAFKKIEY